MRLTDTVEFSPTRSLHGVNYDFMLAVPYLNPRTDISTSPVHDLDDLVQDHKRCLVRHKRTSPHIVGRSYL